MFRIGDDIVATSTHSHGVFKEGELFKVRNILPPMCRCGCNGIDIGIKTPSTVKQMWCSKCNTLCNAGAYLFFSEKIFKHLDDYADISELKKIAATGKIE